MHEHKNNLLTLIALACVSALILGAGIACQPGAQPKTTFAANQSGNNAAESEAVETGKSTADTSSSLATPTDAYKTAFAARQKSDVNALRRVLSKLMLEFLAVMGADEKKSVDEQLKELAGQPQAASAEARNEKIAGDEATLEYLDESGKWKSMDFVREDGEWKLTISAVAPLSVFENTIKK